MLTSTFQHIPQVGEKTEHDLWKKGSTTWEKFLESPRDFIKTPEVRKKLVAGIYESQARLDDLDNNYFRTRLDHNLSLRAFPEFREFTACLDIETTGLSPADSQVTTVCVHSDHDTKSYILGKNLHELKKDMENYKYLITFNGARFDLPFLKNKLTMGFKQIHLDLMYPLRNLGYWGGLKKIEKVMGLDRESDGTTGKDAIYLWYAYKNNTECTVAGKKLKGKEALEHLVKYNEDDTVNLMTLAEKTLDLYKQKSGLYP